MYKQEQASRELEASVKKSIAYLLEGMTLEKLWRVLAYIQRIR